jgi:hypothetical protein
MRRVAIVLACFAGMSLLPHRAFAAPPRAQVYVQPGVQTLRFTGDVGQYASAGLGLVATQGVQSGAFGAYLSIGTDYYLTNQPPPPYTRGLQTFSVSTGLRFALPVEVVRPLIGLEYTSLGVSSNALTRFTGDALHFNGIGANLAARWEGVMPLYVEASVTTRVFPDMDRATVQWGFGLAVGIAGFL